MMAPWTPLIPAEVAPTCMSTSLPTTRRISHVPPDALRVDCRDSTGGPILRGGRDMNMNSAVVCKEEEEPIKHRASRSAPYDHGEQQLIEVEYEHVADVCLHSVEDR